VIRRKIGFTPMAERQINALHAYISANANEERANGYVARITSFCNSLSVLPMRGMKRDDIMQGLRVIGFERHVTMAFVVMADVVVIEGIFYGGRDFAAVLQTKI